MKCGDEFSEKNECQVVNTPCRNLDLVQVRKDLNSIGLASFVSYRSCLDFLLQFSPFSSLLVSSMNFNTVKGLINKLKY